jgi:hypothetical protein
LRRKDPKHIFSELNISSDPAKHEGSSVNLQTIIALLLILLMIFGIFQLISLFNSRAFHGGYEKLVMPLIARLSSSGSLANSEQVGEGENATKEWVWMPKKQHSDTMSVGKVKLFDADSLFQQVTFRNVLHLVCQMQLLQATGRHLHLTALAQVAAQTRACQFRIVVVR